MTKFYFETEHSEWCYHLDYFKAMGLDEMELFEAIPERIAGIGWCKEFQEVVETGGCGKVCDSYNPKNGKNGICLHKKSTLFTHGEKVTIKFN